MAVIAPLCSSSKGNSIFVGNKSEGVLIDVGCSFRNIKSCLDACEINFESIKAIVITHEHSDHIKALSQFTKHSKIPVYASHGTMDYLIANNEIASTANLFPIEDLPNAPLDMEITAFKTPHDSAESVGYTIQTKQMKIGCCTDLGIVTDEVERNLLGCNAVLLEANYESQMLTENKHYPLYLKKRIASSNGHLSNYDSSDFAVRLVQAGATRIILGHLSQENNTPQIAEQRAISKLSQFGMTKNIDFTLDVAPVMTTGKYIAL